MHTARPERAYLPRERACQRISKSLGRSCRSADEDSPVLTGESLSGSLLARPARRAVQVSVRAFVCFSPAKPNRQVNQPLIERSPSQAPRCSYTPACLELHACTAARLAAYLATCLLVRQRACNSC